MTTNQINYQKLLEDTRHNKAVEHETRKQNMRDKYLREKQIQSNYDINAAQLAHSRDVLNETQRHNLAQESKDLMYATRMLDETERHNIAQENISKQNLALTERQINNNFAIGMANVGVAQQQLAEASRHNIQAEQELFRHNQALERNDAQKIEFDYNLGLQRNAETQRNNVQNSLIHYKQYEEQTRHNRVTEDVSNRAQATNTLKVASEQVNMWFKTFRTARRK